MSLGLISHFFNEELLMPFFVKHYINMVDEAIMINHCSTDNSVSIIRKLAPHWRIVDTRLNDFNAFNNDLEIMDWETQLKTTWKFCANTTEFLWKTDLEEYLNQYNTQAVGIKSIVLVDNKEREIDPAQPLWEERHYGYIDHHYHRRWRYIHRADHGHYHIGRHMTNLQAINDPNLFLLYYSLSPWPQCLPRKLQIQTRIPQSDKDARLGFSHITNEEQLREIYRNAEKSDLLQYPEFSTEYYKFLTKY